MKKDESKTKKQLIAELEELRRRLDETEKGDEQQASSSDDAEWQAPSGITRREALRSAWVAPVILTVVARPEGAYAQGGLVSTTCSPTRTPTTREPTVLPTISVSQQPTTAEPTPANTAVPTTVSPTRAPTTREPTSSTPMPTTAEPTMSLTGLDETGTEFPTVDSSSFQAAADPPTAAEDLFRFTS